MNKLKFTQYLIIILLLTSCGKSIKLSEDDLKWIPYKGNETLIFNSSTGDADTIFLTGTDQRFNPSDPLDVFPTKLEHFTILAKYSDPNPPSGKQRYLEGEFLDLFASKDKLSYLSLNHMGKDARFYGGEFMDLMDLSIVKLTSLTTQLKTYNDIILLTPKSNEYSDRSNFIVTEYWSKSEGLIRYDKKDGEYWELVRRYAH